jgi:eukaryotic-like serine/threonine-protein kinase
MRDQLQAALGAAYTIERELGGGGMSRGFVAVEHALGRRVVIKVLAPELAAGVSAAATWRVSSGGSREPFVTSIPLRPYETRTARLLR